MNCESAGKPPPRLSGALPGYARARHAGQPVLPDCPRRGGTAPLFRLRICERITRRKEKVNGKQEDRYRGA